MSTHNIGFYEDLTKFIFEFSAIFHGCKNDNFQLNFFYYFLIFAQNI